jgi:hypothetical protein
MRKSSNQGNIIVSLLAVTLLGALQAFYFFNSHYFTHGTNLRRYTTHASTKEILFTANELLTSPKSLLKSVYGPLNNTGGLQLSRCFDDPTYDCPAGGGPFSIYREEDATVFSDAVDPDRGLSYDVKSCTGFSNAQNNVCVLKLALTWKPTCPPLGPCNLPSITVTGQPTFKIGYIEKLVLNLTPYTFTKQIR